MVDGVTIDSREVAPGALFVPIVAERDGHDFIASAVQAGAVAYLTAKPVLDVGVAAIEVADTGEALLAIGRLARSRLPDRVVGVTGSVGKTSTKDLLAAVLGQRWTTTANVRSFNNELGVPLTLAGAVEGTEATVIEMGARGPGHIARLCDVARPTIGVVTVVQGAHLEFFGNLAGVAAAKGELVEALPASGTAVLNADDPLVAAMAERTSAGVARFGVDATDVEVHAEGIALDDDLHPQFRLVTSWGSATVHLAARGRHQVVNALAAATAGLAAGVSLDDVVVALGKAALSPSRMDLITTPAGLRLLDDAYNANPASMAAALQALAELPAQRRVAVLGTMAELGPDAASDHAAMAELAAGLGIEVVAVGEPSYGVGDGIEHVVDRESALVSLRARGLGAGDAVLVKASRVAALERVAEELRHDGR